MVENTCPLQIHTNNIIHINEHSPVNLANISGQLRSQGFSLGITWLCIRSLGNKPKKSKSPKPGKFTFLAVRDTPMPINGPKIKNIILRSVIALLHWVPLQQTGSVLNLLEHRRKVQFNFKRTCGS